MAGKICRIVLYVSTVIYITLIIALKMGSELCIGTAVMAVTNAVLVLILKAAVRFASENGYKDMAKAERILSVVSIEALIITVPLFLTPILQNVISEMVFVVYVNLVTMVYFVSIIAISKGR